jgi:hypothetical protein
MPHHPNYSNTHADVTVGKNAQVADHDGEANAVSADVYRSHGQYLAPTTVGASKHLGF